MKGIIFSAPMVRALGEGRKTQTRRLIKPQPPEGCELLEPAMAPGIGKTTGRYAWRHPDGSIHPFRTRYRPGERLYVKETWADVNSEMGPSLMYRADQEIIGWRDFSKTFGPDEGAGPSMDYDAYPASYTMWWSDLLRGEPDHAWRSPAVMPEWAARYHIEVLSVEPQRICEISEDDAAAEGIRFEEGSYELEWMTPAERGRKRIAAFRELINSLHPGTWNQNLWYARMEIKLLEDRR